MERKFTIAQLELRRLNWSDVVWLLIFSVLSFYTYYLKTQHDRYYFAFELITVAFCTNLIILSPIGLKFRSVYFSLLWLTLSVFFIFNIQSIKWIPILDIILYHVIRLVFWRKFNREFIPFSVGRGRLYRYISEAEEMGGSNNDKNYMKLLIWCGDN